MGEINRSLTDTGVMLSGQIFAAAPIVGTGVTPAQAVAMAAPILAFLATIPYTLDEHGRIAYRMADTHMNHLPELRFAAPHPRAGELIWASYEGDYHTMHGGAAMPWVDLDYIPPHALEIMLKVMTTMATTVASAT
jgi:hypothetical protein